MVSKQGKSEEKINVLAQEFLQETKGKSADVFLLQVGKILCCVQGVVPYGFCIVVWIET